MAYVTVNQFINTEFEGVIFHPRYPTEKVEVGIQEDFPNTPIAETLDFKVMGDGDCNYRCLAWAVQKYGGYGSQKIEDLAAKCYSDMDKLADFLDLFGYVRTYEATRSVVDVWDAFPYEEGSKGFRLTHFSLLTEYGWTSKLGTTELIRHGRYDLEVSYNGDDEDPTEDWMYGRVIAHFRPKKDIH